MIGTLVSHYEVVEKIGEGGMAEVYRAVDTRLKRSVALKFLRPTALGDEVDREQFMREAQAAAAIDHPNICAIYEIDERDGRLFIAMPYVEGRNLKDIVADGPMEVGTVVGIGADVARGLEAAHRRGIVHRDVKCSNIMVTREGLAKITDFGIATLPGGTYVRGVPVVAGTSPYMSPEQVRGEETDLRSDIWSLGVCLYEMLTARVPFHGDYAAACTYAILNEEPAPIAEFRPGVPDALCRIVEKALAKNPDHRYANASLLLADLTALAEPISLAAIGCVDTRANRRSVAVLPFVDMSPRQDKGYFCDGIAEELINALAHVKGLYVAARTSSFAYKGKVGDIREIGKELRVDAVVEGSLREATDRLRINVQLVNVADGYHIWSEQYDRDSKDILAIQGEIANHIVESMQLEVKSSEKRAIEKLPARDTKAYEFYLRGREYFYRSKRKGIEFAIEMFDRAIKHDPRYALAYAGMADCRSYLYMYFGHSADDLAGADVASKIAVELDPKAAEAHASRGLALSLSRRWNEAEAEFEDAIRCNPRLFEAFYFYARTCFAQGKHEMAARLFRRACEVSPHDYQAPSLLAFIYNILKEPEKSKAAYRMSLVNIERRLETHPDDSRAINLGALTLVSLGETDLAIEWGKRSAEIDPDDPYILYGVACVYGRMGQRLEEGLDYFGRAIDAGFAHRDWIEHDEDLAPFRTHPLFQALVSKMK